MSSEIATNRDVVEASPERMIDLGELWYSAGFLLHIAQLMSREKQYALIRDKGGRVSLSDFTVLKAVALNPGISQGLLADLYRITWPSMSRLVAALEKGNLLRRVVPPEDRRCVGLELTAAGHDLVNRQSTLMNAVDAEVFGDLSDEEREKFISTLRKIIDWKSVG
ncbi:MarR family transcriptional regulator [Rhizobium sp. FKY42]|uniref:MarR family winged helix-turn-helix transcriptional regulator n=1 Tax=Rhizobium sp. FKY42 TaxID=2562310 RepID=UPI0010BFD43C|nr:MarR family transcriptional regulator [Rhizobium sp. FKY42]